MALRSGLFRFYQAYGIPLFCFANSWMNFLGRKIEDFHGESISGLLFSISGSIIFNYFLAWLLLKFKIDNGIRGFILIVFVIALSCFAFETFTQDRFSIRPYGLSLINSGSIFLNFCVAGILLGSWKKYQTNC